MSVPAAIGIDELQLWMWIEELRNRISGVAIERKYGVDWGTDEICLRSMLDLMK
jgi:hypothetical protein